MDIPIPPELIDTLARAESVAALTGAGISAESGIPTFREAQQGLWARYDPMELATPEAFDADPALVWRWYAWRRGLVRDARSNPGHDALAAMENHFRRFTLVTQNVDGLHRAAGSRNIHELHGNIRRTVCSRNRHEMELTPDDERGETPPDCPVCGSPGRPDVVWFGEALPAEALEGAIQAAGACDVFLCVGTSTIVQPAASLPFTALETGARVVEINPQSTPLTRHAHDSLRGEASTILPALLDALEAER